MRRRSGWWPHGRSCCVGPNSWQRQTRIPCGRGRRAGAGQKVQGTSATCDLLDCPLHPQHRPSPQSPMEHKHPPRPTAHRMVQSSYIALTSGPQMGKIPLQRVLEFCNMALSHSLRPRAVLRSRHTNTSTSVTSGGYSQDYGIKHTAHPPTHTDTPTRKHRPYILV